MFIGEIIWIFRVALGDNTMIKGSLVLDSIQNYIFWFGLILVVFSTSIIMLNFIVAEAAASYQKITTKLDQIIQAGKSDLISEADSITWNQFKNSEKFPKYLVVR